jgi:stage II sporulation protein AA (anti-sigma F factor antagonist)
MGINMEDDTRYLMDKHTLIIELPKELDHHSSIGLKEKTEKLMSAHYVRKIVFDFKSTQFMDSSGIGVLLGRYKRMQAANGEVLVCNVDERVNRILKMSGIYKIIKKYATREQALERV